jgi:hypothetical protein
MGGNNSTDNAVEQILVLSNDELSTVNAAKVIFQPESTIIDSNLAFHILKTNLSDRKYINKTLNLDSSTNTLEWDSIRIRFQATKGFRFCSKNLANSTKYQAMSEADHKVESNEYELTKPALFCEAKYVFARTVKLEKPKRRGDGTHGRYHLTDQVVPERQSSSQFMSSKKLL